MCVAVCIRDIPGIGTKLSSNLLRHYVDDASAIAAIRDMQVREVSGISVNQALKFAINLFYLEHQVTLGDVLKTPNACHIYEQILAIIRHFFSTEYARKKLELFFPLPPEKIDIIKERFNFSENALDFVQRNSSHANWQAFLVTLGELRHLKTMVRSQKLRTALLSLMTPES